MVLTSTLQLPCHHGKIGKGATFPAAQRSKTDQTAQNMSVRGGHSAGDGVGAICAPSLWDRILSNSYMLFYQISCCRFLPFRNFSCLYYIQKPPKNQGETGGKSKKSLESFDQSQASANSGCPIRSAAQFLPFRSSQLRSFLDRQGESDRYFCHRSFAMSCPVWLGGVMNVANCGYIDYRNPRANDKKDRKHNVSGPFGGQCLHMLVKF